MKSISIKRPIVQHTTLDLCLLCSGELSDFFDLSDKSVVAPFKPHAHTLNAQECVYAFVFLYSLSITGRYLSSLVTLWRLGPVRKRVWADCSRQDKWSVSRAALLQDPLGLTVDRRWVSACFLPASALSTLRGYKSRSQEIFIVIIKLNLQQQDSLMMVTWSETSSYTAI